MLTFAFCCFTCFVALVLDLLLLCLCYLLFADWVVSVMIVGLGIDLLLF